MPKGKEDCCYHGEEKLEATEEHDCGCNCDCDCDTECDCSCDCDEGCECCR